MSTDKQTYRVSLIEHWLAWALDSQPLKAPRLLRPFVYVGFQLVVLIFVGLFVALLVWEAARGKA